MITRSWHGRVPAAKAEEYYQYLVRTGLADYQATTGNRGVLVQRWIEGEVAHFLLTTLWESVDSIRQFAGPEYEAARYYPEDDDYLLEREPHVTHAEAVYVAWPDSDDRTGEEVRRLAAEIDGSYRNGFWGGGSIIDLFHGLSATEATAHPIPGAHSAWEIALHLSAWNDIFRNRIEAGEVDLDSSTDWPQPPPATNAHWEDTLDGMDRSHSSLVEAVSRVSRERLQDQVPGRPFTMLEMLHGVAQHSQYHAGQVVILCKALRPSPRAD